MHQIALNHALMGSAATDLIIDPAAEGETRGSSQADDRRFFRFLLVALALHALLLIRVQTAEPRRLGAPEGADDAISVSIITERDLNGRATVEDRAAGRPAPIPPPPTPQTTTPPPPTRHRPNSPLQPNRRPPLLHPHLRPPQHLSPRKSRRRRPACARRCRMKPSSLPLKQPIPNQHRKRLNRQSHLSRPQNPTMPPKRPSPSRSLSQRKSKNRRINRSKPNLSRRPKSLLKRPRRQSWI